MQLDAQQQAAVQRDARTLVVRAGAGSGKTRMLLARAERQARPFRHARLFAFTRAAAAELRQRAGDLPVEISTVHAHAAAVCARHLHRLAGFREGWAVLTEADDQAIRKEAEAQARNVVSVRRANGLVTYGELLELGLRCLRELGDAVDERGGAVLVDEAQDLTAREWEWIAALQPELLTVVGDPAQAIYGWRGGLADVLVGPGRAGHPTPRSLLEGATWCDLPANYRSRAEILELANRLAIPGRVTLEAPRGGGGLVEVRACSDEDLLEQLTGWGSPLREQPGSWAVLSRTRARLQPVFDALTAAGVPVRAPVLEGDLWESSPAARELLDLLHLVARPHDSLHLARVLGRAGLRPAQLLAAEVARAGLDACSLWNWACGRLPYNSQPHRVLVRLAEARALATARDAAAHLVEHGVAPAAAPVQAIPAELGAGEFLAWLASPEDHEARPAEEPAVELATIHGAKGREWAGVVLLGLEEGHLPTSRGDEAEERRLAYVAVTRARDRLILHHAPRRPGWRGQTLPAQPSRFLHEMLGGT